MGDLWEVLRKRADIQREIYRFEDLLAKARKRRDLGAEMAYGVRLARLEIEKAQLPRIHIQADAKTA